MGNKMARILIAEDDESIRSSLGATLEEMDHEVYVSPNGEHALETLQNSGGFDLLISDTLMPTMGGRQLIESVLKQKEFASIPVLIMSANISMTEVDGLLKAGAMGFLSKPVNLKVLEGYVNSVVKR